MRPKKIILIIIDSLRKDHLGCYGYKRNTSPNIDTLAKSGILFKYAFSACPNTVPSIASVLTSKYPSNHSMGFDPDKKLDPEVDTTLATVLNENEYRTAAFLSSSGLTGINSGFDIFDEGKGKRDCAGTNEQVLKWLDENHMQDFFLLVHYSDLQGPYLNSGSYKNTFVEDEFYGNAEQIKNISDKDPTFNSIPRYQILNPVTDADNIPVSFESDVRYYKAQYDGCIRNIDENIQKLIEKLKVLKIFDDSLIIITSDHGVAFGENNLFLDYGLSVTLDQIEVPLVLKFHKGWYIKSGILDIPVSTLDIMLTILSLCNNDLSFMLEGYSLKEVLEGKEDNILKERTIMSENERQFALISPNGLMELKKKDVPTSNYHPYLAALLESLNGKKYYWDSGNEYVLAIPFDQYQRYKIISDIINKFRTDKEIFKILDVGAGFENNLKKFLPYDEIFLLDKNYPKEYNQKSNYIIGDITKIGLNKSYDFIISIDAYEHISPIFREKFINKLIDPSKIATIIAAPFDTPGVREYEVSANEVYKISHGMEYKWLHEHIQNGLPSLPFTLELIKKSKYSYTVIPNGYLLRWFEMVSTYMLTEGMPEFTKSMEALYEFYNKNFYAYDNLNPAYRHVIVVNKSNNEPDFSEIYAKNIKMDENFTIKYESLQSILKKIRELSSNLRYKELLEKRSELTELTGVLQAKEIEINEMKSTSNSKDSLIKVKDNEIIELKDAMNVKASEIIELNNTLQQIHMSITWKSVMKFQKIIDFFLPNNTRRRHCYNLGLNSINIVVNEGWRSLWIEFKEKLKGWVPFKHRIKINNVLLKLNDPTIDIIIPVYNHGKYLQECIESAINQTYSNINIIIVDDYSSESLVFEVLKKYETNPKIKIDYHKTNKGISETLNDGIIMSSGNYLAFLDCDDIIVPNAIEKVVDFIKHNTDKYFIYTDRININQSGETVEYLSFKNRGMNAKTELLLGMYTSHLKVINRECFSKVGLFAPKYDSSQDYDIALRISEYFDFGYINDYLYKHRVHEEQCTQRNLTKQENLAILIKDAAIQRRKILHGDIRRSISIVMLTFNRLYDTKKSIESIFNYTKLPFELIILDNNSDSDVREYLKKLEKKKSNVKIIFEDTNLGCGRGRKKAVKFAKGNYIVTLDNDICVTPLWLENFIIRIEDDKKIAAACAKVVFPDGKIQYNGGKLEIKNDFIEFSLLDSNKNKNDLSTFRELDCDWIPGGAMIIKREFLEKVEYREDIEGAYEDNDYSLQIKNIGGRVVNCPLSEVVHYHLYFGKNISKEKRYMNERYANKKMMNAFLAFYKYNKLIIKDKDLYKILNISDKSDAEIRKLVTTQA
ncbi:MAG: glycosyltransferase [Candidatus Methanoperedens sp.]|nr:glycosyltransferase [Candidatus Methanoperedens sp.]